MVAINLVLIGRIEESISTGVFRNECHIEILKARREIGFTSAVDVVINSINYNLYENGKASPPIQFYGYATLVFQDCLSLEIPLHYPRQRIYHAVQWEALRQWRNWVEFFEEYQLHRKNDLSLATIMGSLNIPYEEFTPELKQNEWIELPLREIHIKCQDGTQFTVEHTQWQPVPFKDPFTDLTIDGKSKQVDGDKDKGLPTPTIQPKRNPANDPFAGNKPISGIEELGTQGLGELSPSNLTAPNNGDLYVVEIVYSYFSTCPKVYEGHEFYQIDDGDSVTLKTEGTRTTCGATTSLIYWDRTSDGLRLGGGNIIGVFSVAYAYRFTVPAAYSVYLSG